VKRDQPTVVIDTSIIFVVGTAKLCPPNTYLDDKENRMFIEISPHEGMWVNRGYDLDLPPSQFFADWESYRLNLNFVTEVDFKKPKEVKRNEELIINRINFVITSVNYAPYGTEWLSLDFSKKGGGEFQRIKRIIDENTIR